MVCTGLLLSAMFAVKVSTSSTPKKKAVNTAKTKSKKVKPEVKPEVTQEVIAVPEVIVKQEDILAEYKGGRITKQDLEDKISKIPAQAQSKYKTVEGQTQLLDMMTVEDVFYQKALTLDLQNNPIVTEKITAAKKQFYIQEFYKRTVADKVALTEADKQVYYKKNLTEFYVQPYLTIMYIQPSDDAQAAKAMNELKRNEPFDSVSARYSINTYAKGIGGKIKNIRLNGYIPGVGNDPELDVLLKSAEVDSNKILGPQKTTTGISIIKLTERIDGKQRTYLECEAEIDQKLRPEKEADLLDSIIAQLKKEYKVVMDTTSLELVNLREPAKNTPLESIKAVSGTDPALNMTIGELLAKFNKMSPQEQMMYVKGDGAAQMADQELTRALMYVAAAKDKQYDELLKTNPDFKQTERYYILTEIYKKLVVESIQISKEDSKKYYDSHLDAYTTPTSRKILTIWAKDQKAAKKALKKFNKAFAKQDLKALTLIINQYSVKPERDTLDNQYKNGIVTGVGADQNFSDLIWKTPIGKVSPIFKTAKDDVVFFGVISENPQVVKTFTEVEPRIMGMMKKEKEKTRMEEVKAQLFNEFEMKKYPEKLVIKLTATELFELADNSAKQKKYKDTTIYYDQIIQFYPNGTDDYKATFMKAFIVTEEIGNKEQGLQIFKDFLKKYPIGELNESAQFMIDELEGKNKQLEDDNTIED